MATVSTKPATAGQRKQAIRLIEEVGEEALDKLGLNREEAQWLFRRGGEFKQELGKLLTPLIGRFSAAPNIVVVPDLAAVELTALVQRELGLTLLDQGYKRWNYYSDLRGQPIPGRGKRFESSIWNPKRKPSEILSSEAIREYFRALGFYGHTGAFIQWMRTCGLQGYHASIPEDDACWRSPSGGLHAPFSYFGNGRHELRLGWSGGGWSGSWFFVGFREVPL